LLTAVFDWLGPEIVGGKNKSFRSAQLASITYGSQEPIDDDVVGDKKIFRTRRAAVVTKFLDDHNLNPGDVIQIERLAAYAYKITPV
jgi:hypothetical protein